ncbi:MAG: nucleotidyltransferase domain-containing protein [Chloroflexi bacterium]|nr:MAG: nucleotidyltransferase domain-containing protein [Chloroflexota bacterium]
MRATDAAYLRTARRRARAERRALAERRRRAWEVAHKAACLLRERYRVERVVLFGSLLHEGRFTLRSDVDLAVWDLPWPDYLHALGEVLDLDPEIEVNLVDATLCHPLLREAIEREGVEL